ncbi:hypothetical protein D1B17_08700 [Companilactobacillus zhachilii]|uniref:Uncharacterized protein n=1 Tax=Companilactobacillus zhachilii TaxID=2304606 RepID=A0A386PVF7_9LACO|nr:hypothetical protein [Companilactobacillus zhachilii]AYE38418.1 hypothetical protein D1B17_07115 [Companilactobacillus zhachilii]AYE38703.1 hypothetical protein D1B17_08700 [Companilactobacillus zhachilii]
MNKEKVIGISNRLNSIVDEANRHPNGNPGHITWSKAVYAIECLSKEVNSKPVMPEVFDDFAKKFDLTIQQGEQSLDEALNEIYMMYMHGGSKFNDLEDYMRSHGDEEFYTKCVDALVNGYEVEHG